MHVELRGSQAFSKPILVNSVTKEVNQVSFLSVYPLVHSLNWLL